MSMDKTNTREIIRENINNFLLQSTGNSYHDYINLNKGMDILSDSFIDNTVMSADNIGRHFKALFSLKSVSQPFDTDNNALFNRLMASVLGYAMDTTEGVWKSVPEIGVIAKTENDRYLVISPLSNASFTGPYYQISIADEAPELGKKGDTIFFDLLNKKDFIDSMMNLDSGCDISDFYFLIKENIPNIDVGISSSQNKVKAIPQHLNSLN